MVGFLDRGKSAFTHPSSKERISHEEVLAFLVKECGCRAHLQRRLDIMAGKRQRIGEEVDAVLSAAECGDTEQRFVCALLEASFHRISGCLS